VVLTFALAMITRMAGHRLGVWLMAGGTCVLVAWNAMTAFADQAHERESNAVTFDRLVHIFRQVHSVAPVISEDAAVLFYVNDYPADPLGICYATPHLMKEILGVNAAQISAHYAYPDCQVNVTGNGVTLPSGIHKTFDQIVLFRCTPDGTVSLLLEFPKQLLPADVSAVGYRPLALLKPGPIDQLAFFRYLPWSVHPLDIFDTEGGIGLVGTSSDLRTHKNHLYRKLRQDAELVINPAGRTHCAFQFLVDPPALPEGEWNFEIRDEAGRVLATAVVSKHHQLQFDIPLDATRLNLVHLHMTPVASVAVSDDSDWAFRISRTDKENTDAAPNG
jgi:hypothetical protein